jgi:hypothetical protein
VRPPGEIRQALARAAVQLHRERDGATWRDMAEVAQVGYLDARRTVEHMARAGGLVVIGVEKRAHSRRWMNLYAPAVVEEEPPQPQVHHLDLEAITRAWAGL